jgi:hypothetical protein
MASSRLLLENHLAPFLRKFGLRPDWHTDLLLRLEPQPNSRSARAVLDFERGFWEAYEELGEKAQLAVFDEVLVRLVGPYEPNRANEALVVICSLSMLRSAAAFSRRRRIGRAAGA